MPHTNRSILDTAPAIRCFTLAIMLLAITGCSKQSAGPATTIAADTPAAALVHAPTAAARTVLNSSTTAGGIPAEYQASFSNGELKHISETRRETQHGEYDFHGARLLRYVGAPLEAGADIEIRFDLDGAVTLSRAGAGAATASQISAVRTRAQLLRSHALARRATQAHDAN